MSASRFEQAVAAFERINAEDPRRERVGDVEWPREQLRARQLVEWVHRLDAGASEALRLAAHCQHVGRFRFPRTGYPEGRVGYLRWRTELSRRHAEMAREVLVAAGYDPDTIATVQGIVQKQGLRSRPDVQTIEDALCLVFLEHEFTDFCAEHDEAKLLTIVRKTWAKMSPTARQLALGLPLSGRPLEVVQRALAEPSLPA
jgi:hypothetical protein